MSEKSRKSTFFLALRVRGCQRSAVTSRAARCFVASVARLQAEAAWKASAHSGLPCFPPVRLPFALLAALPCCVLASCQWSRRLAVSLAESGREKRGKERARPAPSTETGEGRQRRHSSLWAPCCIRRSLLLRATASALLARLACLESAQLRSHFAWTREHEFLSALRQVARCSRSRSHSTPATRSFLLTVKLFDRAVFAASRLKSEKVFELDESRVDRASSLIVFY